MPPGEADRPRRALLLRGLEYGARLIWSWEWADGGGEPRFAICSDAARAALLSELDRAIPETLPEEKGTSDAVLLDRVRDCVTQLPPVGDQARPGDRARLIDLAIAARCMWGALAEPRAERDLMGRLGAELLPADLIADVRREAARGAAVELRIVPTPDCACVPWGLLGTGRGDERLIELCDVVMMSSGGAAASAPAAAPGEALPLYVIDPDLTLDDEIDQVLTPSGRADWVHRVAGVARRFGVEAGRVGAVASRSTTRLWLSDQLLATPRSRLVYLGHVTTPDDSGRRVSLELNDPRSVYDPERLRLDVQPRRRFTALAAIAGTRGALDRLAPLRDGNAMLDEFGRDGPRFPSVDANGDRELHGIEIWPMPPRVAIIACRSGADGTHAEPFGLVTALHQLGAQAVIATRWSLLTDAVEVCMTGGDPDLSRMAEELDDVLQHDDLVPAFGGWQRDRLRRWRESPVLSNAPLGFAAVGLHLPG